MQSILQQLIQTCSKELFNPDKRKSSPLLIINKSDHNVKQKKKDRLEIHKITYIKNLKSLNSEQESTELCLQKKEGGFIGKGDLVKVYKPQLCKMTFIFNAGVLELDLRGTLQSNTWKFYNREVPGKVQVFTLDAKS